MTDYRGFDNEPISEHFRDQIWAAGGWHLREDVGSGILISTMWDGNYRPESGPFETVVFGVAREGSDNPCYHWATKADARSGHERLVVAASTLFITGGSR